MLFKKSLRMRKNLRHFARKKVDQAKYIDDFYLDNGLAYISCNVRGIEDIISRYSVRGYEDLNPELESYIEQNAYHIPVEYPIVLEICGHEFNESEKTVIETAVKDCFGLRLGDAQIVLHENVNDSLILLMGLAIFMPLYFLLEPYVSRWISGGLNILYWLFAWELIDVAVLERRHLRMEKRDAAQLASMKVVFRRRFVDDTISEAAAEQIIEEMLEEK